MNKVVHLKKLHKYPRQSGAKAVCCKAVVISAGHSVFTRFNEEANLKKPHRSSHSRVVRKQFVVRLLSSSRREVKINHSCAEQKQFCPFQAFNRIVFVLDQSVF